MPISKLSIRRDQIKHIKSSKKGFFITFELDKICLLHFAIKDIRYCSLSSIEAGVKHGLLLLSTFMYHLNQIKTIRLQFQLTFLKKVSKLNLAEISKPAWKFLALSIRDVIQSILRLRSRQKVDKKMVQLHNVWFTDF